MTTVDVTHEYIGQAMSMMNPQETDYWVPEVDPDHDKMIRSVMELIEDQTNKQLKVDEAHEKCRYKDTFGLPNNPSCYNSSEIKVWINHTLTGIEALPDKAAEIAIRCDSLTITGDVLSKWNKHQYQQVFGNTYGDILHNRFKLWVDDYKRSQSYVRPQQAPSTDMSVLAYTELTELEKQELLNRGMDEKFFGSLNAVEQDCHKFKFQPHDQIVPSPTNSQMFDECFDPHMPPFYNPYSSPALSMNNCAFQMNCGQYDNPPLYQDAINEMIGLKSPKCSRRPPSVGSTGDISECCLDAQPRYEDGKLKLPDISHLLPRHQTHSQNMSVNMVKGQKRKRGRPRKEKTVKPKRKQPILYQFILMHLNNPESRRYVQWVEKTEGVFRFHSAQKDNFAKLWGQYKRNREPMSYQNMARALRNYTKGKRKIMERVKKKLHYKFVAGVQKFQPHELA